MGAIDGKTCVAVDGEDMVTLSLLIDDGSGRN